MIYYICSPYHGKTPEQVQVHFDYAVQLTREMLLYGQCPITPHLYITACLNGNKPDERKIRLEATLGLLEKCDAVIVGQRYGISEEMAAEIEKAKQLNKPVFYHDQNITDFKKMTIICEKIGGFTKTRIVKDNVELQRVTSLSFSHEAGAPPVLNLKIADYDKCTIGNYGKCDQCATCIDSEYCARFS